MIKYLKVLCLLFCLVVTSVSEAAEADVKSLCENKNLTCADLKYTLNTSQKNQYMSNSGAVCTECPMSHLYWACARRGTAVVTEQLDTATTYLNGTIPTCVLFPSCNDMGYRLSATQVGKIQTTRSCSACPYDGTKWACIGPEGLLKVD